MPFEIHPRLLADSRFVCDLPLSRVVLSNDARYPWCILIPRIPALRELFEVPEADRVQLFAEIDQVSRALQDLFTPDKLNVAAIGNLVPQLHVHVIARFATDAAWPQPVWGRGQPEPYTPDRAEARIQDLRAHLGEGS
ncbi:HIT family protein [Alkalilimnicola ehrlichii]|uniref:HIT family protein n=1 Tax=Alkalilimnicola ehrlichii TaxID=351052 RepID=A0A3E0WV30_9GAMM|nr:HIT family protein [Alkalilimnicola ehrlichii]RFA29327.1 HIT family protein [Alkalilimnicola ehrlichii]RFA36842.1 HIT family protein [Alkalilimnicola ehrlichii]